MKRILLLLLISNTFAGSFGGNIALIGQFPQDEFKAEGVSTGFGIDLNGLWYPVDELAFGINLGGTQYGSSTRQIPFSYYVPGVYITEITTNDILYGHLLFRIIPFQSKVKLYFEGLLGVKNLSTSTELKNNNCTDDSYTDHDDCEIASSTNASDNTISYGAGGGIEVSLFSIDNDNEEKMGDLSFFISAKYLWGGDARYLKKGAIEFSNPAEGPVQTTFNWSESKTNVLQLNIGLSFHF